MNKLLSLFTALLVVLTLALPSQAGITGLGWDNGKSQLTARVDNVDLGVGGLSDENANLTFSADYLAGKLASSSNFSAYTVLGADYNVDAKTVGAFAGVMPELTVANGHLAFSTRFGVSVPLYNDGFHPHYSLSGAPVSLVNAVNFKILF